MIRAAVEAAPTGLRLLAVTVLTSMDAAELRSIGIDEPPAQRAVRLGEMAAAAGVHGLVCSAAEITPLRSSAAQETQLVVPGIRPAGYGADDQRRVATAGEAIRLGADMLVVGRPITRAADPAADCAGPAGRDDCGSKGVAPTASGAEKSGAEAPDSDWVWSLLAALQ